MICKKHMEFSTCWLTPLPPNILKICIFFMSSKLFLGISIFPLRRPKTLWEILILRLKTFGGRGGPQHMGNSICFCIYFLKASLRDLRNPESEKFTYLRDQDRVSFHNHNYNHNLNRNVIFQLSN